jgi:hypothetical protein
MNLGGFAFVLAAVIASGSGGAHVTARHEPAVRTQSTTGGSLSPSGTTGILTQAGQAWHVQVLMDDSMPMCMMPAAAPPVYWLQFTVPGDPVKKVLSGTASYQTQTAPPSTAGSSCEVTVTFSGPALAQVPVTAALDLDQGGTSSAITLTVSRHVTLYYYLGLPAIVGGAMAVIMLLGAIWLVRLYDEHGDRVRRRTADWWARPLAASGAWTANDSWATNITAVTTILTAVLGVSTATAALFPGVAVDRFVIVNIVAGGIVAVAPLAFGVFYAVWTRRNPGVMADAALTLPVTGTARLAQRSTLHLTAATTVKPTWGRTRQLNPGTELTVSRATLIVLGAGGTAALAVDASATVAAGATARLSDRATFEVGGEEPQEDPLPTGTGIGLPAGASVAMGGPASVDLTGGGSIVLAEDCMAILRLPTAATVPSGRAGTLPADTQLTLPRGTAVTLSARPAVALAGGAPVTLPGRITRVRVPRPATARFNLPGRPPATVVTDTTAALDEHASAPLTDLVKVPAAVITLPSGADLALPGGAEVPDPGGDPEDALHVKLGHSVHVPPHTRVSVQAGAVMTAPGTSDVTVNARAALVIDAEAGHLAIAADDLVGPQGEKVTADATRDYPVRIVAPGGAKLTVAGTADVMLPAGTVSRAPYRRDYPLPRQRSLQVPQGASTTLFGNLRMILATAVITMFGIGAEIGIAAVLGYGLSEANEVWRSVMLGVTGLIALLVLCYAVTAVRAIADPRPGSTISATSGTSFTL